MSHATRFVLVIEVECEGDFDRKTRALLDEVCSLVLSPHAKAEYVQALVHETSIPTLKQKLQNYINHLRATV